MAGSRLLALGTRGAISGLQNPVLGATSTLSHSDKFRQIIPGETSNSRSASSRPSEEGSDRDGPRHHIASVLQPTFRGTESVRQMETHHRFIDSKYIRKHTNVQDGHAGSDKAESTSRQLGSIPRPAGCVPTTTNPHSSPQVPAILLRRDGIPVSGSPIRPINFAVDLHSSHERSEENATSPRSTSLHVPRRLASDSGVKRTMHRAHVVCSPPLPTTGLSSQRRQINVLTDSRVRIFRLPAELTRVHVLPDGRTSGEDSCVVPAYFGSARSHCLPVAEGTRVTSSHGKSSTTGKVAYQGIVIPSTTTLGLRPIHTTSVYPDITGNHRRAELVDAATQCTPGNENSSDGTTSENPHRRLTGRVGRSLSGNGEENLGCLAAIPKASPHKLVGTESDPPRITTLVQRVSEPGDSDPIGQLNSSLVSKQTGGDKVKTTIETCLPSLDPVRRPKRRHQTASHTGKIKCFSGSAIEERPSHIDRVGAESRSLPTSDRGLGNATSRLVRDQRKPKASKVRLTIPGCGSVSGRRHVNVVDESVGVRVPTVCSTFTSSSESTAVSDRAGTSSTTLARGQLVSASVRDVSGRAQATTSTSRPFTSGVDITFQPSSTPPSRVSAIRSALTHAGFSEAVASRAAQPQRESTLAVYESKWRSFVSWCHTREVDPIAASAAEVADFLLQLSTEKKLQLSTIEGYRMAIASVLRSSCGTEVGRSDTLRALMKSIALSNIRDQPTVPEWDLLLVLNRLRQAPFEPIRLASLKLLTWKTLFLVTLASGKRRGEIHALSFQKFLHKENWSKVTFSVISSFIAKTQILEKGAKSLLTFEIKAMAPFLGQDFEDDHLLCPVRAVRVYLERTKTLRKNQQLFFISPHSSFKYDIKPATISAWLKKTIILCYEMNKSSYNRKFRAHSIRSKAVSWAFHHQASLEQILAAGTWRSANTFTSFYLKEISSTSASGNKLTPFIAAGRVIDVSL